MRRVRAIVYRYLTDADFFNMYKPTGTETGGWWATLHRLSDPALFRLRNGKLSLMV